MLLGRMVHRAMALWVVDDEGLRVLRSSTAHLENRLRGGVGLVLRERKGCEVHEVELEVLSSLVMVRVEVFG